MNILLVRTGAAALSGWVFKSRAQELVGIYGRADGCGGCERYTMNSDVPQQARHWTSVAEPAEPWYLRGNAETGEPNGDYTAGCWLDVWGRHPGIGYYFNDERCGHYATEYVCSTNYWAPSPPCRSLGFRSTY